MLGFIVLVSGTSLYNELMKPCLPGAAERRRRLRIDLQVCDCVIASSPQALPAETALETALSRLAGPLT